MKKTDTLADWLHAWTYDTRPVFFISGDATDPLYVVDKHNKAFQAAQKLDLRMALRKAERVSLDNAFLAEIAKKTIAQPPEMLAMSNLAMLPFEKMFVEYDDGIRIRAVAEAAKEIGGSYAFDANVDYGRAGLLFERIRLDDASGWNVTHVSDSEGSLPVWPFAAAFNMHGGPALSGEVKHPFIQNLRASGWGYAGSGDNATQYAIHEELLERGAAVIEHRFALPVIEAMTELKDRLPPHQKDYTADFLNEAARQSSGKLRWGVAILAALNSVPTVRVKREASGHFQHRLKSVPKLSTTHVRIDAKPGHEVAVYDRHFHEATGRHNRRHEVRGHWRVVDSRKKRDDYWMCSHVIAEEDGLYALCGKCGHLLRWIDHHERGDAALGYVFKDGYEVKG